MKVQFEARAQSVPYMRVVAVLNSPLRVRVSGTRYRQYLLQLIEA